MNKILKFSLCLIFITLASLTLWFWQLDRTIRNKVDGKRFIPPTEFYSSPIKLTSGQIISIEEVQSFFHQAQFRQRAPHSPLFSGDYSLWSKLQCERNVQTKLYEEPHSCIAFRNFNTSPDQTQLIVIGQKKDIIATYQGPPFKKSEYTQIPPILFAQYIGNSPTQRKTVSLGKIPTHCKNALLAIEDNQFLEHSGISPLAILRASWSLIKNRKITQGGSTITQQLVKNYFLNSERTFKRKIIELAMALILEYRVSKDEILELYLNSIYMGQQGVFQIRGFAAASKYYFNQSIPQINLAQCSLLAAILNSPGLFNPFKHQDRSLKRRNHVLDRMFQLKMISEQERTQAQALPLPLRPQILLQENAPYYIKAVRQKLKQLNISLEDGGRVYTSIDLKSQKFARQAIQSQLRKLEQNRPHLKEHPSPLQASLISINIKTGQVRALIGGRHYKSSHFNRILESKRQVGSLMKPFVYLTALESLDEEGTPISPMSEIQDSPFTHKYEGQKWTPHNYNKKFIGNIPLYFALKNSLNVPTAKLGLQVGLEAIIDTAKRLKIKSDLKPVPSLTLGAFELTPWELAKAYTTIARMGNSTSLSIIQKIESLTGELIYEYSPVTEQVVSPDTVAVLIGMLKETLRTGTARGVRKYYNFNNIAAGKTGTTSQHRDAWFAGFTPKILTIVWLGFDDNTSHKLTGASGAAPIWANYMKHITSPFENQDFQWPENVSPYFYKKEELEQWDLPELQWPDFQGVELIIKK